MLHARALTIAGSDSGGGAGIQADLKTFTMLGTFGCSVITALTAQNTVGVHGVETVPPEFIKLQLDCVLDDIEPEAAKTGMLANVQIIEAVAEAMRSREFDKLVVDPVMVSVHGHRLLDPEAEQAVIDLMFPVALLITPNLAEAEVLSKCNVGTVGEMKEAARILHSKGAKNVLIKGGHLPGNEVTDLFYDGNDFVLLTDPRIPTSNTHGTGCTLSAAIAAYLAQGEPLIGAVRRGRTYLRKAIERSFTVGKGVNPVNHLWPLFDDSNGEATLESESPASL